MKKLLLNCVHVFKKNYLSIVKRIFRYLVGIIDIGLWYSKISHFDLIAYYNGDSARDKIEKEKKIQVGRVKFLEKHS